MLANEISSIHNTKSRFLLNNFCNKNVDIKFSVHDTFISENFSREDQTYSKGIIHFQLPDAIRNERKASLISYHHELRHETTRFLGDLNT